MGFGDFLSSITSAVTKTISSAASAVSKGLMSVGNVFRNKDADAERWEKEAKENAIAEEKKKKQEEEDRKKATESRKKKEEDEADRIARQQEEAELGDPNKWRERYVNKSNEIARRKWQDAASLSWDGTTFILDPSRDPNVQAPTSKVRIFCSSTFTDTHKERNKLLGEVYKKMRAEAEGLGIDFSFIDMRYGVRDENTMDHLTWEACKAELVRCRQESAGIFFLTLQGEKYGTCVLVCWI